VCSSWLRPYRGIEGAFVIVMSAFVLAGFPTTSTLTDLLANLSSALP